MPITVTIKTRDGLPVADGYGYMVVADVEFDTNYAGSGGEDLTLRGDLLLPKEATVVSAWCSTSAGFVFEYDATNEVIIARWVDTSTDGAIMGEVPGNENGLDGVVTTLLVHATV